MWRAITPSSRQTTGNIRIVDPTLGAAIHGSEEVPDFTAHWRHTGDWGHVQLAGIVRQIRYETDGTVNNEPKGHETGWGLNLTGNIKVFQKDTIHLGVVYGEGIASYMNDGGVDLAAGGTIDFPHAEAVPLLGIVAWYDHYCDPAWSTSIGYSLTQVDNTSLQLEDAFHRGEYASINLLWTPDPSLLFGGEFMWGQREDNDGETGDDVRFQFSAKYSWGITVTP